MATASTLRTLRIGGQIDPAWLTVTLPWTSVRAVATLSAPDDGAPVIDPSNGAHEHPLTVANSLQVGEAGGQWSTAPLKPTQATGANAALVPSGLTWSIVISIQRGNRWQEIATYVVPLDGDYDYSGHGKLITVAGASCVDINYLITIPVTVPPIHAFETAVLGVLTDNPQAIAADLTVTGRTSTGLTIASSTGTDAAVPLATSSLAGLTSAADKVKLDATSGTNTGDQTATTVPVTSSGNLGSSNVQAALVEIQGDVDTAAATLAASIVTSAGTGSAGKLVKLDSGGHFDQTTMPVTAGPSSQVAQKCGIFLDALAILDLAGASTPEASFAASGYPLWWRQPFINGIDGHEVWMVVNDPTGARRWRQIA